VLASSRVRNRRISTIESMWFISTGHASRQAAQVKQLQSTSSPMASWTIDVDGGGGTSPFGVPSKIGLRSSM